MLDAWRYISGSLEECQNKNLDELLPPIPLASKNLSPSPANRQRRRLAYRVQHSTHRAIQASGRLVGAGGDLLADGGDAWRQYDRGSVVHAGMIGKATAETLTAIFAP